jgi:festuclavine dehydrogenase
LGLENFLEPQYLVGIKEDGKMYTACGDGKIPFIAAGDISAVAFHALTDKAPHNTEYRILGPELLIYDEV